MKNKNEKILEKVKLKIAISRFEEEEKKEMRKINKSIFKVASVACLTILSITGVVFAENIGDFVKNLFGANTSEGVDIAVNNGYVSDVKTEVQSAEGIEVNVDSFIMDDFNFAMNFKVTLDEKYDINDFESIWLEDLRIIDEQENIVFSTNYNLENVGTPEFEPEYWNGYSMLANKTGEHEFILSLSTSSSDNTNTFPRSKHLKINFTRLLDSKGINEQMINKVYEGNWNFEIDVPKEFYNRENIIYKVKSCNDKGININQITAFVSNTAMKLSIPVITTDKVNYELLHTSNPKSIYDKIALQKEYVETSDGKKFETAQTSDGDGGYGLPPEDNKIINYHQTFNLTKYDATDEITIHIFTNKGEEIIIQLEKN